VPDKRRGGGGSGWGPVCPSGGRGGAGEKKKEGIGYRGEKGDEGVRTYVKKHGGKEWSFNDRVGSYVDD